MLGSGTNTVPFTDSFESYSNGTYLVHDAGTGSGVPNSGWYSEAPDAVQVIYDTSIGSYLGQLVLTNASITHTNVLKLDSTVSNVFEYTPSTNRTWIDMMMKPRLWDEETPPAMSNCQAAVYFDSNGFINAWCSVYDEGMMDFQAAEWLPMSHPAIGTDDWIRLTIELVYTNPAVNSFLLYSMRLNSADPVTNYAGMLTEEGPIDSHGGKWLVADYLYQNAYAAEHTYPPEKLHSITFSGSGLLEEMVVTNEPPFFLPPHTIYASNDVGGAMTPAGSVTITEGRDANFTIGPKVGYDGTNVNVDGALVGWTNAWSFTNVVTDHTIYCMTVPQKRWLSVTSEYNAESKGTPTPSGLTEHDYNEVINASVAGSPIPLELGAQLVCYGWTRGVGAQTNSGTGTSTSFPIQGATTSVVTTLAWNWNPQFYLDLQLGGTRQGTLDQGDQWVNSNGIVDVTATTNLGAAFVGWFGDIGGAQFGVMDTNTFQVDYSETNDSSNAWIRIQMSNSTRVVEARFSGGLTTSGSSMGWLSQYFSIGGEPGDDYATHEAADADDFDGDGLLNWEEYVAGTVPTDPKSLFAVSRVVNGNGSNRVDFIGSDSGGNVPWPFGMFRATNLLDAAPWSLLPVSIPRGSSANNTWWDTNVVSDVPAFYLPQATNTWTP